MKPRGPVLPLGRYPAAHRSTHQGATPRTRHRSSRPKPTWPAARRFDAAGNANPRPEPARSVSTLSASRACSERTSRMSRSPHAAPHRKRPRSRPGLFHPENAPELSPSGLCSARRSGPVSRTPASHAVGDSQPSAVKLRTVYLASFEGLLPPSRWHQPTLADEPAVALLAFSPLRHSVSPR
jgi:hypothetical protein